MAQIPPVTLPPPSPEQRRAAAGQFERAKQVLVSENYDYAIQLLMTCCKLDPANLTYRQTLRQAPTPARPQPTPELEGTKLVSGAANFEAGLIQDRCRGARASRPQVFPRSNQSLTPHSSPFIPPPGLVLPPAGLAATSVPFAFDSAVHYSGPRQ